MSLTCQLLIFLIGLHSWEVAGWAGQSKCGYTASSMPLHRVDESAKVVQTRTGGWELLCLWLKKVSLLMKLGQFSSMLYGGLCGLNEFLERESACINGQK